MTRGGMIFVDRSEVAAPSVLEREGLEELERARIHYEQPLVARRRVRFVFEAWRGREVWAAAHELFHGKCAFCGSGEADGQRVVHFRPVHGVVAANGRLLHDHYWWLANEWRNLYLACGVCARTLWGADVEEGSPGLRDPGRGSADHAPARAARRDAARGSAHAPHMRRDDQPFPAGTTDHRPEIPAPAPATAPGRAV